MTDWRDHPSSIRPGEELDHTALSAYLSEQFPTFTPPLQVKQYPSGYSNLTYQISWVDTTCILRRPPFGAQIKSGHDMHREYKILSGLSTISGLAPKPRAYCEDLSVLGTPFYIMERIDGVILRTGMPEAMQPDAQTMTQIARSFIDTLVALHKLDYAKAGLKDLGQPEGYIQRQITGWIKRYNRAKTDEITAMDEVGTWLHAHQPPETTPALIHNDFKYDNLVLSPDNWTKVIGMLDWEMATIGDPLMDLGTTLGYWVEPDDPPAMQALKLSPTTVPGNPTRAELATWYCDASGRSTKDLVFYYVYGLFKIGVIVQQIYARYKQGHTKDKRFAGLIHAVRACSDMASRAISLNRIEQLYD